MKKGSHLTEDQKRKISESKKRNAAEQAATIGELSDNIQREPRPEHKETRCAKWTLVVYPESAPDNWRDVLDDLHIEWVESPLHDKDVNPTGEPKKPHWHILLIFSSVKAYEQVLDLTAPLCGTIPQRVHNTKGLVRYMCHLDNPEKQPYKQSDIKVHGGADIYELLCPSKTEIDMFQTEMLHWVEENDIRDLADLNRYACEYEHDTWYPILTSQHSMFIRYHIQSRRHQIKERELNERLAKQYEKENS